MRQWLSFATLGICILIGLTAAAQEGQFRAVTVVADHYTFDPATITVNKGDVVKITFIAKDIPHSFTIDGPYRISKRAGVGQAISFQFRADQAGSFPIYCNLTADPKCKEMKGTLVVH